MGARGEHGQGTGPDEPGREIEVPDEPRGAPQGPAAEQDGPYRNLLVPLVVVPALIVMVFVLVWTFFGTITGREASPEENVERLLHGGYNEREQAAFALVRQALEDWGAGTERSADAWHLDETLLPQLRRAWEETSEEMRSPGDVPIPLAVAILLAQLGDEEGVARLAELTRLGPGVDPEGEFRMQAAWGLGALGERLRPEDRDAARAALAALLEGDDEGLRSVAAVALQAVPGEQTEALLRGLLTQRSLEIRGNAALSLARLGAREGADVLRELLDSEAYRREHEREERKWTKARLVSESRRKALLALASLDLLPEEAELSRLAEEDPDPELRELARTLLERAPAQGAPAGD